MSARPPEHESEEIYIINPDGTGERRLTYSGDGKNSNVPAWQPGGTLIAFMSSRDGDKEVYVMSPDGSDLQKLTDNDVFDAAYSWSADGRLVFTSERDGTAVICTMNADGSNVRRIGPGFGGLWLHDKDLIQYRDYPASEKSGELCFGRMDLEGRILRWPL